MACLLLFILIEISIVQRCGHAIWLGLGMSWCAYEHERLSRLMALLHSRKPSEPSSDMENIIVSALTSNDTVRFTNLYFLVFFSFFGLVFSLCYEVNAILT